MGGAQPNKDKSNKNDPVITTDQKIEIILAFFIIIASLFSAYLGGWMANNNYHEQQKFDIRAAEQQLFIEINYINQSIQPYAFEYMHYYDFSVNGKNVNVDPNTNSITLVFDENRTHLYEIYSVYSVFTVEKIIGFPVRTNGTLRVEYPPISGRDLGIYLGNGTDKINALFGPFQVVIDNPVMPGPLYNDHGKYYAYEKDISKFNKTLSQSLYVIYNYLTRAELDRQYIQNYLDTHPSSKLNGQYFDTYMDMRSCIIFTAKRAPTVLKELEKEEN